MKLRTAIAASALLAASAASAQIADIVNQIPGLIQPALSGSLNYKGFVETGFAGGFGDYRANVFSVSTSQGFRYSNWFFMGAGRLVMYLSLQRRSMAGYGTEPKGQRRAKVPE